MRNICPLRTVSRYTRSLHPGAVKFWQEVGVPILRESFGSSLTASLSVDVTSGHALSVSLVCFIAGQRSFI